jgi:hypothetical protein
MGSPSPVYVVWRGSPLLGAGTIVPPAPFPIQHLDVAETADLLLIANVCHVDPLSQATCSELDEIYLHNMYVEHMKEAHLSRLDVSKNNMVRHV